MKYPKSEGHSKGSQFNPHTGLPHTAKHIALERRWGLRRQRKAVLK